MPPETIVMDVTEANFVDNVVQCPVPVVLYFTATWCKPCQTLGPKLEAVARSAKGAIRLAKVDVDVARALAAQLQVSSVPTVFGVVGGKAVANFQGAVNDAELRGFFDQLLTAGEKLGAVATPVSGRTRTKWSRLGRQTSTYQQRQPRFRDTRTHRAYVRCIPLTQRSSTWPFD